MSSQEWKLEAGFRRQFHGVLAALVLAAGCAPEFPEDSEEAQLGQQESSISTGNSMTPNGLSANGLSLNGLSLNGLSANGLSTTAFASWFNSNPADVSDMVMRYLVRCAVPSGQSRTWTHPSTGRSYTWAGELGLTPGWAGGRPSTEVRGAAHHRLPRGPCEQVRGQHDGLAPGPGRGRCPRCPSPMKS